MRFVSWNVNGLRAALNKGLLDVLSHAGADAICLQETRVHPDELGHVNWPKGFKVFWNPARKKGYSGTAILAKIKPLSVTCGMGTPRHDEEGRVICLELAECFLVNVYTPNAQRGLARLDYRIRQWDVEFRRFVNRLDRRKPVVFCGDLNVAHKAIDLARPKQNERSPGFTIEERRSFDKLIRGGFVDTFRAFEPGGGHYSWWSYRANARAKNIGWRIDYCCVSRRYRSRLKNAFIWPRVTGSDHCPVGLDLK